MKEKLIKFKIVNIVTEQYATIASPPENGEVFSLSSGHKFGISESNHILYVGMQFQFLHNNFVFLQLEVSCFFQIEDSDWLTLNQEDCIELPVGFAQHLLMLTIGTARGILHAKTENTIYNNFRIPLVNATELIKENVKIFKVDINSPKSN